MARNYSEYDIMTRKWFGKNLRAFRLRHNITIASMAKSIGMSYTMLAQIEHGDAFMSGVDMVNMYKRYPVMLIQLLHDCPYASVNCDHEYTTYQNKMCKKGCCEVHKCNLCDVRMEILIEDKKRCKPEVPE